MAVQGSLHFTPWETILIAHHHDFSGKYSAKLQLIREGYSCTPYTIACSKKKSSKQLIDEFEQCKTNELVHGSI